MDIIVKEIIKRENVLFLNLAQYEAMEEYCKFYDIPVDNMNWESYNKEERNYFIEWKYYMNKNVDNKYDPIINGYHGMISELN